MMKTKEQGMEVCEVKELISVQQYKHIVPHQISYSKLHTMKMRLDGYSTN